MIQTWNGNGNMADGITDVLLVEFIPNEII